MDTRISEAGAKYLIIFSLNDPIAIINQGGKRCVLEERDAYLPIALSLQASGSYEHDLRCVNRLSKQRLHSGFRWTLGQVQIQASHLEHLPEGGPALTGASPGLVIREYPRCRI